MAETAPPLPTHFPCWCRAVYSWGGETKKDLGFVEGDLIECLNAGDGSWWMGRLHRDRRAMGLFPCNFVKVLDDSFKPVTRTSSPLPDHAAQPPERTPAKSKSVFRKPYQAYASVQYGQQDAPPPPPKPSIPRPARRNSYLAGSNSGHLSRYDSQYSRLSQYPARPGSRMEDVPWYANTSANVSASASANGSLAGSAFPPWQNSLLDGDDAVTQDDPFYNPQVPSPSFPVDFRPAHSPSPIPDDGAESPPPPPAPPHRVALHQTPRRSVPAPSAMNDRYPIVSREPSPAPPSPSGMTPSPLRDAMDDVMSSLEDMALSRPESAVPSRKPSPAVDPWSPDAYEELRQSTRLLENRPRTALGIGGHEEPQTSQLDDHYPVDPPQLSNYVERMEHRLRNIRIEPNHAPPSVQDDDEPPPVPLRGALYSGRPTSSMSSHPHNGPPQPRLRPQHSAYELGRQPMNRTLTTRTALSSATQSTATHSSASTQCTSHSLMSGPSASGVSATSAGSLARRKSAWGSLRRPRSAFGLRRTQEESLKEALSQRPQTPQTAMSLHSNRESLLPPMPKSDWNGSAFGNSDVLDSLTQPSTSLQLKPKRSGFLRKLMESAKTGAASARSSIAGGQEVPRSPTKSLLPNGVTSIAGGTSSQQYTRPQSSHDGSTMDWMQVRRDVNRSNSLSRMERQERIDKCLMMSRPVIDAVDLLDDATEGDEGLNGLAVNEPTAFFAINMQLVDKAARFINSLPPMTNPISLAQGYVCRPYRSDAQRARAIFTWVSEKIAWEEDFEGAVDCRRVIATRRGCAEEVAVLVYEMCAAVGLPAEIVHGHLKPPGEMPDLEGPPRPNHWWNAVLVDGEWRILDCSLASPSHPRRSQYSAAPAAAAEPFYFLTRPMEACYTHVPSALEQQHIVPPVDPSILLALPCVFGPYFRNSLRVLKYSTALVHLDGLELLHIDVAVPADTELVADVSAQAYGRDYDGDRFETGERVVARAMAQPEWRGNEKVFRIKAALPNNTDNNGAYGADGVPVGGGLAEQQHQGLETRAVLHVYAGKRGLMHSLRDNPHPPAFTLPMLHTGEHPPYEFLTRHPTPHAQRHDLYVAQPQCRRLACNNTFVFAVRQHPSSLSPTSPGADGPRASLAGGSVSSAASMSGAGWMSPSPLTIDVMTPRPGSAMSMTSSSASGSNSGSSYFPVMGNSSRDSTAHGFGANGNSAAGASAIHTYKPAKLAIQAPSGKIMRLSRKAEGGLVDQGSLFETVIKISERGTWRGLVLADRSVRWCVFAEWEAV